MKTFTLIIIFLLSSHLIFSQDCKSFVWFKQGSHLEYRSFAIKEQKSQGQFEEVARFSFTVEGVSDSMVNRTAYVTKRVEMINKKRIFEKQLKVICLDGRIGFEMSHFLCDTIIRAYYPLDTDQMFSFVSSARGGMIFPFSAAKSVGSTQELLVSIKGKYYDPGTKYKSPSWSASEDKYAAKSTVVKLELLGEETVTCPAGTFNCFKLLLTREFDFGTRIRRQLAAYLYYNKEIGIIKWEDAISYTELTAVSN